MRTLFAALALFSLLFVSVRAADQTPAPAATDAPAPVLTAAPDIHITSCQVASGLDPIPQKNEVGLAVRFQNNSPDELREIVWRAKYGAGYIDFRDDGQFSPGTRIDNFVLFDIGSAHIGGDRIMWALFGNMNQKGPDIKTQLQVQQYASFNDPSNCQVISTIRSSDDATWTDLSAPKDHYLLPTPGPSPNATLAPPGVTRTSDPLDIAHCSITLTPSKHGAGLAVGFRNRDAARTISKIVIRASYGLGTADFEDVGTFSPDVYIKHTLSADAPTKDRTYVGFDDPASCSTVSVDYADGTAWTNPSLASPAPPPSPVPDSLNMLNWASLHWVKGLALPTPTAVPSTSPSGNNSASPAPSST